MFRLFHFLRKVRKSGSSCDERFRRNSGRERSGHAEEGDNTKSDPAVREKPGALLLVTCDNAYCPVQERVWNFVKARFIPTITPILIYDETSVIPSLGLGLISID